MRLLLTAALALSLAPTTSVGQVVHLPPPHRPADVREVLLTVRGGASSTTLPSIRVADGRIYFLVPDGSRRVLQLGKGTIAEFLISLDEQDRAGFIFYPERPEVSTSEIEEGTFLPENGVVALRQRTEPPNVQVAAAIGFIANESRPRTGGNSLMRNAGIDLDLVARKAIGPGILRARLGFRTAEPVATGENTGTPTTSMDPRAVVEGAQAIVLGGHFDLAITPPEKFKDLHLSVGTEGTQYWAAPESFRMPSSLIVKGEDHPIGDYFTEDQIAVAQDGLDRVIPMRSWLGGVRGRFGGGSNYVFYVTVDAGRRDFLRRALGTRVVAPLEGDPAAARMNRLIPVFYTKAEWISRFGIGIRLSDAADLKVDVVSPLQGPPEGSGTSPTLRLMIATPGIRFGR